MNYLKYSLLLGCLCSVLACQPPGKEQVGTTSSLAPNPNPAAEGFDLSGSDQEAILIADRVMETMGGRKSWDDTRYLCWDFFGFRHLIWDKHDQRVRIETADSIIYLVNLKDMTGNVLKGGVAFTHPDSLASYLEKGKNIWINDSYWLVMPFKLKDSGVTLKYLGEDLTKEGEQAEKLQLTFEGVGTTPENKYLVFVDKEKHLVTQWAFYRQASQDTANFILPWGNYKSYGNILLSDERGDRDLSQIMVMDSLPDYVFESFDPIDLNKLAALN